ncbi:MarR family transcriptional regulator [Candidatus Thorarchaeota archaeon]|nr:MAG: MarR family transcriptional regulator [Candidatus Thorarchaeota archaeon]
MKALTKSAVDVLSHLASTGPMSPNDITESAEIPPRTVSHALKRLLRYKLCKKIPNLQDMRRPLYVPNYEKVREFVKHNGSDSVTEDNLTILLQR